MPRIVIPLLSLSLSMAPPLAGPSLAHSQLRSSAPAEGAILPDSPDAAVLVFNEAARLTALRLFGPDGGRIDLPAEPETTAPGEVRAILPPLAAGGYEIEWRALSVDGHPIRGRLRFSVGEAR